MIESFFHATRMRCAAAVLSLGLVVAAPPVLAGGRYYNAEGSIQTVHRDWMSTLPDSASISALSVPGTHDTMALAPHIDLDIWTQTQSLSLRSQLDAGIRALDIRCRHFHDAFTLHHEAVYLHANFDDVLTTTIQFLREHPRETVLMRIQEEYQAANNTRSFQETFKAYQDHPAYKSFFWKGTSLPSLGDVRGKIVVLDKFEKQNWTYGIPWRDDTVSFQDSWTVDTVFDIPDKWNKVRAQLDNANAGTSSKLYANFLSGSGVGAAPYVVAGGGPAATGVNERALDYLVGGRVQRAGVLMMDYPGAGLIDAIISLNYRLLPGASALPDFDTIFKNVSHSIGGNAESRWNGLHTFLQNVAPGRYWHVMALKDGWGGWMNYDTNFAQSDSMDDYVHIAFTSRTVTSAVSPNYLAGFVNGQLGGMSGGAGDRAVRMQEQLRKSFPFQYWSVLVKKAPGGLSNWAYSDFGAGYKTSHGDYTYAVQGFSAAEGAYLYEHGGYEGRVLHLSSTVDALGSVGFDDILSSVRILGPYQLTACEHPSRTGRCVSTSQSVSDITTLPGGVGHDQASYASVDRVDFRWSEAGPTGGFCTLVNEPASPYPWEDNYLCSSVNYGLRYSYAGPLPDMRCTQLVEPGTHGAHGWTDNYLCVPPSSPVQFSWSYTGPIAGKQCVRIHEGAEPGASDIWSDNYLCY